jgi:hypothetical protein
MSKLLHYLTYLGIFVALIAAFLWIDVPRKTRGPIQYGVTFSQPYAEELGLNWRELLTAILDDLHIRHFRIPAYWSVVQPTENTYDWRALDYQLDEIAARQGTVTLAIGAKLPRWPECWIPEWAKQLSAAQEQTARLSYIEKVVTRYKEHPALRSWQVENEALFPFGQCPKPDAAFFKKELRYVASLDPKHSIATTDSGELSTWLRTGPFVDELGISVYRSVTTWWGSVWHYTLIPPYWYAHHAWLVRPFVRRVYVSEFQMEPWANQPLPKTPLVDQFKMFNLDQMEQNVHFAERMQFDRIDFWGVEWWWWMKTQQKDARFWDKAKVFFNT